MKKLLLLALTVVTLGASAQDVKTDTSYWRKGGFGSLAITNVYLQNWVAGGQKSLAINLNSGLFAIHEKGKIKWENTLDLGYGIVKLDTADFVKSDDRINLVSKLGYAISDDKKWFGTGVLDFRTQFYEGLDADGNVISDFMAPGYLLVGLGVDYFPNKNLSIMYTPVTGKFTFVKAQFTDTTSAYGVEQGKTSRAELGSYLRMKYAINNFESKLELFTNYLENFGNIDVNWQNTVNFKLTKVLSANLFLQILYDDDIKIAGDDGRSVPRVQLKNVVGLGLTANFGDKLSK